ncbi:MAG: type II toxin-antitoxin system VapC family toxin [Planctomycetota bacterium]
MKLLLDTHTFLWLVDGNSSLSATAQAAICDPSNALFFSIASVWEMAIKTSRTNPQLKLNEPLDQYIARWTAAYQVQVLPIDLQHALHVAVLPKHHADPFDRMLIAQAEVEAMTLVSADRKFASYSSQLLW